MDASGGAKDPARQSKRILISSAVLGALFTIFGFLSLALPLTNIAYLEGLFNYDALPELVGITVAAGVGLRWMLRRYDAQGVQAGSFVGAVLASVLNVVYAWVEFSDEAATGGKIIISTLVTLVILYAVIPLTKDPDSESSKHAGTTLIWRIFPGRGRSPVKEGPTSADRTGGVVSRKDVDAGGMINKRQLLMYLLTGGVGWFLGTFFNPLRQTVNNFLITPLGGRPSISLGRSVGAEERAGNKGYSITFSNFGGEPAEEFLAHIGYNEKITSVDVSEVDYQPPRPAPEIEITDGGVARIHIERLGENNPNAPNRNPPHQGFFFYVAEGTRSSVAGRIKSDNGVFLAYRYSWTFQGERYYDSRTVVYDS